MTEATNEFEMEVDDAKFPLVSVRFPVSSSEAEIDRYYDTMTSLARRGKFVLVVDLNRARVSKNPASTRQHLVRASARWDLEVGNERLLGQAIVFRSRAARLLYTVYQWMHRGEYPSVVFENLDDAVAWATELLGDRAR